MTTVTKREKIKTAKDNLRQPLRDIVTAEAVLRDANTAAAPHIAALLKASGEPGPHKIRLDSASVKLYTFRKSGEYMGDPTTGAALPEVAEGQTPAEGKAFPLFRIHETDPSATDDE